MGLIAQVNINAKADNKWKGKSNFVMSCLAFKGFIPTNSY